MFNISVDICNRKYVIGNNQHNQEQNTILTNDRRLLRRHDKKKKQQIGTNDYKIDAGFMNTHLINKNNRYINKQ